MGIRVALLIALAAITGCFSPSYRGDLACGENRSCPARHTCSADNRCVPWTTDAAVPLDRRSWSAPVASPFISGPFDLAVTSNDVNGTVHLAGVIGQAIHLFRVSRSGITLVAELPLPSAPDDLGLAVEVGNLRLLWREGNRTRETTYSAGGGLGSVSEVLDAEHEWQALAHDHEAMVALLVALDPQAAARSLRLLVRGRSSWTTTEVPMGGTGGPGKLVALPGGRVEVAFAGDDETVNQASWSSAGWGPVKLLADRASVDDVAIAVSGRHALVAWSTAAPDELRAATRLDDAWSAPNTVASRRVEELVVALSPDGEGYLVAQPSDGDRQLIGSARSSPGGWERTSPLGLGGFGDLAATSDATGTLIATWVGGSPAGAFELRRRAGGVFQVASLSSPAGGMGERPIVRRHKEGAVAVWRIDSIVYASFLE